MTLSHRLRRPILNQNQMNFYNNQLFHIYNQGNNRQPIFFNDENYIFFLWKMRAYLLPFGDLISYCLMPNHFHWQFFVQQVEIKRFILYKWVDEVEYQRRIQKFGKRAKQVENRIKRIANPNSLISLNESIGILEKSYTRAINKARERSGSLFRKNCKAKDGWIDEFITLRKTNGRLDYRFHPGNDYGYECLKYIHNNPVKAGLVRNNTD